MAELDALTGVYEAAMRPDPAQLPGRRSIMQRHATYQGFRALAVTADADGQLGPPGGSWGSPTVSAAPMASGGMTSSRPR